MAREYFTIFNLAYRNRALNNTSDIDYDDEKIKTCYSCRKEFKHNEIIHIFYTTSKARRRHLDCAVQKNIIDERHVNRFFEKLIKDMDYSINDAMSTCLLYQLFLARKRERLKVKVKATV